MEMGAAHQGRSRLRRLRENWRKWHSMYHSGLAHNFSAAGMRGLNSTEAVSS